MLEENIVFHFSTKVVSLLRQKQKTFPSCPVVVLHEQGEEGEANVEHHLVAFFAVCLVGPLKSKDCTAESLISPKRTL